MERLTEKHYLGTDHYMKCSENCNMDIDCIDCPSFDRLVEHLAAYENTGLEPEEVDKLTKDWNDLCTVLGECGGITRVKALAEAEKEGRLVVLPCKVGDVVFGIHNGQTILPMVAKWIETNTDGWCIAVQYAPMAPEFYRFSDFGKTVFFTQGEAEKALEAMEDE